MKTESRRKFLKRAALISGAMAVAPHRVWAEAKETGAAAGASEMSIARWTGEPIGEEGVDALAADLTRSSIEAIGGMGRFVSRGDIVWVKPNIGWNRAPELAANTNPAVVAALVELCYEAGAKRVKVGDHACHNPKQTYRSSGIEAAAKEAGALVVQLDENRFRNVALGGALLDEWLLYPEIIESDLVINVPIAKHHGLSQATLCMKNLMGVIGGNRGAWHQNLPACLCDLAGYLKPRLSVLDGVRLLTDHGPQGGNPLDVKRADTVAAGADMVALDAFGAGLLGHEPLSLPTIRAAAEAELGVADYRSLAPVEVNLS